MKTRLSASFLITLLFGLSHQALASLDIRFVESAPKDWFSVTNGSDCTLESLTLTIDLSASAGKLIFDTTAAGAGVEVFQPFELRDGEVQLVSGATVNDGERTLSVMITNLEPGLSASFTIDVDDTLPQSELGMIRVSGAEIAGGQARLTIGNSPEKNGTFNEKGQLSLALPQCL